MNDAECPRAERLKRWLVGDLPGGERAELDRHLDRCPTCQQRLAALSDAHDPVVRRLRESRTAPTLSPELAAMVDAILQREPAITRTAFERRSAAAPTPAEPAGYEIVRELGRGGMGVVYLARQRQPDRTVALKMIRAGRFATAADIQRFHIEAQALAELEHDGFVPVYEVGEHGGEPFFAMKFVDGASLAERLESQSLSRDAALAALVEVCAAMGHAHARGIVHRDLKPSNILLDSTSRARVADFGLAKHLDRDSSLTAAGDVLGTPGYMAPEQYQGALESVGPATDVYALGAILYRILTGRLPVQARDVNLATHVAVGGVHDIVPPRRIDRRIPRDLETICLKCLEAEPGRRYADASQLADDLKRALAGEPIVAAPPSWRRQLARWARQQPGLAVTWLFLLVFYLYHLVSINYFWPNRDEALAFHRVCTGVMIVAAVAAWLYQRALLRWPGRKRLLFAWCTTDFTLLTLLLWVATGPRSGLVVIYFAQVTAAALRYHAPLVIYVTLLSLAGYLGHVVYAAQYRPETAVTILEAAPFAITLAMIGLAQCVLLQRLNLPPARRG